MMAALIHNVRAGQRQSIEAPPLLPALMSALPSVLLVVITIGGILAGIFSATEASAIAVAYAFVLGVLVYREIAWAALPALVLRSAKTTAVVMLLLGTSQAMSWALSYEQIPQMASAALLGLSQNPIVILLIINVLLLGVGVFMDMTPAVLVFTPILLPAAMAIGVDPVHFGIIMIANLCIGLCTPPVGTCLFLACSVGNTTIARVVPRAIPIFIAMVVALLLITYVPEISLWLPRLMGL
jgi:tripartite ATP-independent transporter DctM subunit